MVSHIMLRRCLLTHGPEGAVTAATDGRLQGTMFADTFRRPPIQALILMDSMRS